MRWQSAGQTTVNGNLNSSCDRCNRFGNFSSRTTAQRVSESSSNPPPSFPSTRLTPPFPSFQTAEMRKTFLYTLFGLAMTAAATVGEVYYPAGELLPKMSLPKSKRHGGASPAGGLHPHHVSRGSSGAFIPVSPAVKGIPVVGEGKDGKRRLLRKDEVVVPASLQNPASKRALSCGDSSYGVCPNQQMCCPVGKSHGRYF